MSSPALIVGFLNASHSNWDESESQCSFNLNFYECLLRLDATVDGVLYMYVYPDFLFNIHHTKSSWVSSLIYELRGGTKLSINMGGGRQNI